jgi:hypothetical protein
MNKSDQNDARGLAGTFKLIRMRVPQLWRDAVDIRYHRYEWQTRGADWRKASARVLSVLMESEPGLYDFDLTRFLHANRYPLRSKTL